MQYSKKDNTKLTISDRGLYTGISTGLGTTSKAYVLDAIQRNCSTGDGSIK